MRNVLTVLTTTFALCLAACASNDTTGDPVDSPDAGPKPGDPPPPPPPPPPSSGVSGTWSGTFSTDNSLASKGDFAFTLTEDAATHAVTGPFTGTVTAGANGTAFKGTFTGARNGTTLNGTVAVTEPAGVTGSFAFQPAAITGANGGDTIAGAFNIDVKYSGLPVTAAGNYSIKRAP